MESIPILLIAIFIIIFFIYSVITLIKGVLKKDKFMIKFGIISSMITLLISYIQIFDIKILPKPTINELVGKYEIVESTTNIPKRELDKYILELELDGRFSLTRTENIGLCEKGMYDINFENDGNEIGFMCGKGWTMKSIETGIFGHRIVFRNGMKFKKIE